jgi:hypothetical protein
MSKMVIDDFGNKEWRNEYGKLHRLDGPANERADGSKWWFINGVRHRLDGPAIEWADGEKEWWVNDTEYGNFKDFQEAGNISDEDMMVLRLKYGEIGG